MSHPRGTLVSILVVGLLAFAVPSSAQNGPRFEVTITNLTAGQVFTPIVVASHRPGVKLFTLGRRASVPLEILAEAGDTAPLTEQLEGLATVREVTDSGAPLPPGASVTLSVAAGGGFDALSVAAMLVPTNDGFFAVNGMAGPQGNAELTLFSPAYDAGTEANDELCATIPGPPTVCQGEGFNASRVGSERFVHIHRGIQGGGDLNAAAHDWRNPVAQIVVRRIP